MPGERCVFPWCGEQDFHTHQVDGSLVPRLEVYEDLGPTIERAQASEDRTPSVVVDLFAPPRRHPDPFASRFLSLRTTGCICHPYDDPCGGPGGPCRNHGGIVEREPALWEGDQA
jgi:hypothetical protein